MWEIAVATLLFTLLLMFLVVLILIAKARLVAGGMLKVLVNQQKTMTISRGSKLLEALRGEKIFLSSACGGGGVCGQCKVRVLAGGGVPAPTELPHLSRQEREHGVRLACQLMCKQDLEIEVPVAAFGARQWRCKVRSSRLVATFIKEIVLELAPGEELPFRAGGYVQVSAPAFQVAFRDFVVPPQYREDWDKLKLFSLHAQSQSPLERAYSLANYPGEKGIVMLNVRIATPPPLKPEAQPGLMSSYLFSLKPGAELTISGPFGQFFAMETKREMVFIGGGAGMAPLRSHILDQLCRLKTTRKISFWYGARSQRELFYKEDFDRMQKENTNFRWYVALSAPLPGDEGTGYIGFIHQVLYEEYLKDHPAPEDLEYYLCGPPLMSRAVIDMLLHLGVPRDQIFFDDFGA